MEQVESSRPTHVPSYAGREIYVDVDARRGAVTTNGKSSKWSLVLRLINRYCPRVGQPGPTPARRNEHDTHPRN
jgi:hypothetical protein